MQETPGDKTTVRILTDQFVITGEISMFSDTRLTDYIISAHDFIAVTNAKVRTIEGQALFDSDFLDIRKEKIVIIVPEAMITSA